MDQYHQALAKELLRCSYGLTHQHRLQRQIRFAKSGLWIIDYPCKQDSSGLDVA
jgi:hypothetical protein